MTHAVLICQCAHEGLKDTSHVHSRARLLSRVPEVRSMTYIVGDKDFRTNPNGLVQNVFVCKSPKNPLRQWACSGGVRYNKKVLVMHCTSNASVEDMQNLSKMAAHHRIVSGFRGAIRGQAFDAYGIVQGNDSTPLPCVVTSIDAECNLCFWYNSDVFMNAMERTFEQILRNEDYLQIVVREHNEIYEEGLRSAQDILADIKPHDPPLPQTAPFYRTDGFYQTMRQLGGFAAACVLIAGALKLYRGQQQTRV